MFKLFGKDDSKPTVEAAFAAVRKGFGAAALLSGIINILMLTGPLFMLQVYDRVLSSQSVPTLFTLLFFVLALYTMMAVFDFARARTLSRIAHWIDDRLALCAFTQWLERHGSVQTPGYKPVADLSSVRGLIASPAFIGLFELPWFPLYLAIVFMLHVDLGLLATAGAIIVTALALINEWLTGTAVKKASTLEIGENRFSDEASRNAESIIAMGMLGGIAAYWKRMRDRSLATMQHVSERAEIMASISKTFRMFLQSAILALGAWLVIRQELSPGSIVAASILSGRALAPIDQFIGGWKQIKRARLAYRRLGEFMARNATRPARDVVSPGVEEQVLEIIGLLESAAATSYRKEPVDPEAARRACAAAEAVEARLPDWGKKSWRWELLRLRTVLDRERFGGDGLESPAAEAALLRLMELYHCQLETDDPYHHRVRPPLKRALSRNGTL